MEEKTFVWTSILIKKLCQIRFENDCLFKTKKQPWREFHQLLLQNGFPEEMTVDHVRKKWSYTYEMYKLAKKSNNKSWKYYKLFDKHFGKSKTLDAKYESWNDEWRLKLIICISEAKEMKLDFVTTWRTVERAMRCQDLPLDCCIQDVKGLWHYIRMTFNRKHRIKLRNKKDTSDWQLYDTMLLYYQKFEPQYLSSLENGREGFYFNSVKNSSRFSEFIKRRKNISGAEENGNENEFLWSKDITESFIQIRLQHDWLFRQKKWAWNELVKIMIEEYGFPKSLTARDLCRKWAATYSEYQKAQATNNKTWVYRNLFELYLGESKLSLNPLVDWQEEWVCNLISARTDLETWFVASKDQNDGWREVEKRLRSIGLPLDHSLLDLPDIWLHLLKTFRWKRKFANKGMLTEQWPYFEAMTRYDEVREKNKIKKQKEALEHDHFADMTHDDDFEDDLKLFDLKQRMSQVKPKFEVLDTSQCRSCANMEACVSIFEQRDDDGLDVAFKLKTIAGIEVERSDSLPSNICLSCLQELDNAYKFRRKCQEIDKHLRTTCPIKTEVVDKQDNQMYKSSKDDEHDDGDDVDVSFEPECLSEDKEKPEKCITKRKKLRKYKYDYWKVCEICGKHTKNLRSHLDTHATGKMYSCNVCDKKFKFKSALVIHKPIHDPTPKKTCEICGKTFHIMAQYRRHFVYHANERKHECETCGKRFNSLDILRVHIRIHTDERPFPCSECGKNFRTAGCVSRHKRIVHRNIRKVQ